MFLYGVIAYVSFLGVFLYAIGFVGNLLVPKSIDSGPEGPFGMSLVTNAVLLGIFALQHSIMARPAFKSRWAALIPASVERNTYVLFTNIVLCLIFRFWQPMTGEIWSVENANAQAVLQGLFWFGWLLVLVSTFMINHFDLFGLRQAWFNLQGREYEPLGFRTTALYNFIRHPIQTGFLIAFWATPDMTAGHLLFSIMTTDYVLVALQLEERDLVGEFGEQYQTYRRQVSMLLPLGKYKGDERNAEADTKGQSAAGGD